MPIFIYNSLSRKKEELKPVQPHEIKMYVCGPTVYDQPHIGHARSAYIFDVIRRYLTYKGFKVKFVRNVTDVDDKIIDKAREKSPDSGLKKGCEDVAKIYLDSYHQALESLGIGMGQDKIIEPKASEYIPKMINFIQGLIERGAAYASGGDVYFDITRAKDYGKLSNQSLAKMESGARVAPTENKHNPLDFALWKSAKENEPSWDSPWSAGRPGWHIECSVMSSDILGDEFDIHGGGLDLIFPHHENEIAQSEAAGKRFARYWIHHGLLTINGQKMAKSLGNFITIKDFMAQYKDADLLKLFFLFAHYAHPVDYNAAKIEEAKSALERILILVDKIDRQGVKNAKNCPAEIEQIRNKFIEAMDDDFNTPQALACVFELVNTVNKNIGQADFAFSAKAALKEMLGILGITLKVVNNESAISEEEIKSRIQDRANAKKSKDYALADKIRKELETKGVILEDTKEGATWRRRL